MTALTPFLASWARLHLRLGCSPKEAARRVGVSVWLVYDAGLVPWSGSHEHGTSPNWFLDRWLARYPEPPA